MTITPEQLIRVTMTANREDKFVLKEQLAKIATAIPAGQYVIFAVDYDKEDDDAGFTQQLSSQQWAYTVELWDELMDSRDEWWQEREQFRGLTRAFWRVRSVRETLMMQHLQWVMPEEWVVTRGRIPGDVEERNGFYVTVGSEDASHMYEVTFNLKNKMRLIVPVFVDYEPDTEDFDLLIIEDATDLVAGFASELSPTNLSELSETIDVDRK